MAWVTDSLRGAIEFAGRLNPMRMLGGTATALPGILTHQLAYAAYMSSGMLKKVITIPAEDRVREWRDWQAEKDQINAIEKEEERLGLQAKVLEAETLRGIGGGALIIVTAGDHDKPLTPEQIRPGGIIAINVVSRWQITGRDWIKDLASPQVGQPAIWEIDGGSGGRKSIHPSRVICFRGARLPAGSAVSDEEAFWGDSRLLRVYNEVKRADDTQGWFAELVKKAKLTRIGIPDLLDMMATDGGRKQLNERISLIAESESVLNATVYRSGTGTEDPGEKIDDYQVTWAGIPAVMDAFDQRVAAVSDIPFTRLMGRSPAGMNSTGAYDDLNWVKAVVAGQKLETGPCLKQLDPFLLASAGVSETGENKIWWQFAPLSSPTEKELADTFAVIMGAVEKLQATATIPDREFAKGLQNLVVENGWLPGIDADLDKLSEDERYGLNPEPDGTDPSALQATQTTNGGKEADPTSPTARASSGSRASARAANDVASWLTDATPRPLYVQRKLLNAADLIAWAKENGFDTTLPASDMHVTILYSRAAVDPMKMGRDWREDEKGQIVVRPGGPRVIEKLGESAIVLRFACPDFDWRHSEMIEAGGSHDYPEYQPHVTISYTAPKGVDVEALKPFNGVLRFGPEIFEALDLDWKSKIEER